MAPGGLTFHGGDWVSYLESTKGWLGPGCGVDMTLGIDLVFTPSSRVGYFIQLSG